MKKIRISVFITISLLGMNACKKDMQTTQEIPCQIASIDHPRSGKLKKTIDDYIKKGLPGISLLIEDERGTWTYAAGKADIENDIDFTPCHISKAASITKLMLGTVVLKMQEQGLLSLNDTIDRYIDKNILSKIEQASGKTIRQLMNHSTGIFDVITSPRFYLAVLNNPNKSWKPTELLDFVYGEKASVLSDTYPANYSNTNTLLLSMCVEKISNKGHDKWMRELLFDPLSMHSTFYQGKEKIPQSAAQGYYDLYNNQSIVNVSNLITGSGNGYGGVYSNIFDLYVFTKKLFVEKTILSDNSLAEMYNTLQEDDDFFTGAGTIKKFTHKKYYGIGHTGRDLGYSANMFYFPQCNRIMVFFVNYGTNGDTQLRKVFRDFESDITDALLD
jgi:D-alanyl-D-alanine carboxypeptidase